MTRRPPSVARARSPALRERRSIEERREQLLGAGHELFVERPYDQVSMDDVAQRAGVSKALVFHYFSTKRDLYVEIVRRAAAELLEATLVPAEIPPLERLALGLGRYLDFVERNERGYVALLTSGVGVDPEVYGVVEAVRRALAERMLEGLPMPRTRAHEVGVRGAIGFVEHASLAWIEHRAMTRQELLEVCARVLVAAVGLPAGARP